MNSPSRRFGPRLGQRLILLASTFVLLACPGGSPDAPHAAEEEGEEEAPGARPVERFGDLEPARGGVTNELVALRPTPTFVRLARETTEFQVAADALTEQGEIVSVADLRWESSEPQLVAVDPESGALSVRMPAQTAQMVATSGELTPVSVNVQWGQSQRELEEDERVEQRRWSCGDTFQAHRKPAPGSLSAVLAAITANWGSADGSGHYINLGVDCVVETNIRGEQTFEVLAIDGLATDFHRERTMFLRNIDSETFELTDEEPIVARMRPILATNPSARPYSPRGAENRLDISRFELQYRLGGMRNSRVTTEFFRANERAEEPEESDVVPPVTSLDVEEVSVFTHSAPFRMRAAANYVPEGAEWSWTVVPGRVLTEVRPPDGVEPVEGEVWFQSREHEGRATVTARLGGGTTEVRVLVEPGPEQEEPEEELATAAEYSWGRDESATRWSRLEAWPPGAGTADEDERRRAARSANATLMMDSDPDVASPFWGVWVAELGSSEVALWLHGDGYFELRRADTPNEVLQGEYVISSGSLGARTLAIRARDRAGETERTSITARLDDEGVLTTEAPNLVEWQRR